MSMKTITAYIATAALLAACFLLSGCGKRQTVPQLGWEQVSPEVDTLTRAIERCIFNDENADSAEVLLTRFENVASRYPAKLRLRERAKLYRTGVHSIRLERTKALRLLAELKSEVDSAENPYLYHRILSRQWFIDSISNYKVHKSLLDCVNYYEKLGDSINLACNLIRLANRYMEVGDYHSALNTSLRADTILGKIDFGETQYKNRMNLTVIHSCLGNTTARNDLTMKLLGDTRYETNVRFRSALLINAYSFFNDPKYLHQAYNELRGREGFAGRTAMVEAMLAEENANNNNLDSANMYARRASLNLQKVSDFTHKQDICRILYRIDSMQNRQWMAFYHYRMMCQYGDSARAEANPLATARMQYQVESENERLMLEQKKRETMLKAIITVLSTVVIAGIVIILLMFRSLRLKTMMMRAMSERDRSYQQAAASMISANEKETRLREMAKVVETCETDGSITGNQARTLMSSLKVSMADSAEWNDFIEVFSQLHPNFKKELKAHYPKLSVKQIELCRYIKMGLDIQRIARLMSVKPETVWQNRWRLKQKMGLDSDESLQEALASIGGDEE